MAWQQRGTPPAATRTAVFAAVLAGARLLLVVGVGAGEDGESSSEWAWGVEPATASIELDKAERSIASSATIDIAAQRGECEAVQLWLHSPHPTAALRYS